MKQLRIVLPTVSTGMMNTRKLKKNILELLKDERFEKNLEKICQLPARQVVNPLFSLFYSTDERLKWRAITAMGAVVSHLAERDLESARVVMRRLMWNLNDESGGIGWGSAEAMGEIMARSSRLADEYAHILISYIDKDGNYLEHEPMQRGVLWGIGRLALERPDLVRSAAQSIIPHLKSQGATIRGLAAWVMGMLGMEESCSDLAHLTTDETELQIFIDCRFLKCRVKDLAKVPVRHRSSGSSSDGA